MPVIASNRYNLVTALKYVRRRDWIFVGVQPRSPWMVIPQQYSHVVHRPGDHCLLFHYALVCHLHETLSHGNQLILMGRDSVGRDWLVAPRRYNVWKLFTRGGGAAASPSLPDSSLSGPTSATGIERVVAAAMVLAGIAFDTPEGLLGRPDFVVRSRRIAIFAHGCSVHAHGCGIVDEKDKKLTSAEAEHIRDYDRGILASLRSLGWRTLTVWECAAMRNGRVREDLPTRLRGAILSSAPTITLEGI
jgi:DNA mismatch endonuclease Vsr